jgi:hypothetical protein
MAFSFGILGEIDSSIATVAFIVTILFLTGFEFLTGGLEYVVRDNPIYNQMLQRIYKELMIMGFITFVIAMYLASDDNGNGYDLYNISLYYIHCLHYLIIFLSYLFILF